MPDSTEAPQTLLEVVERRARDEPGRVAFTFAGTPCTFGELGERLRAVAALLARRGVVPGDRVILLLPNGAEFFAAFYGTQRAGAVPVPLYPESGAERLGDLARACGARVALVDPGRAPDLAGLPGLDLLVPVEAGTAVAPRRWPPVGPGDLALIQYTSGSTGVPKGVMLRHRHLLTNVDQMIAGMEITGRDVFVSWLPVHHDMGLILKTMAPFRVGATLVLLPARLTAVGSWLAALAEHRGTFTAAPDFAWRLCLRAVRDPSRYDLGSLRVALNAAEPVRAETIRRFHETFGLQDVMVPGYGLAEATVGVSMQPPGTPPTISERGFVAIGRPFPGVELEVVAGDRPAAAGEEGEIVVASPAVCDGYWGDAEATEALFAGPGRIRTGDVGCRDGAGEVYVVGRRKNIILQAGRNLAPQELEGAVEALPFVRRAAAVGIDRGRAEGEQSWVFLELRRHTPPDPDDHQAMVADAVSAIHRRLGLRPGRVLLVPPGTIPLTANGKVRHGALREGWLSGELAGVPFPEP